MCRQHKGDLQRFQNAWVPQSWVHLQMSAFTAFPWSQLIKVLKHSLKLIAPVRVLDFCNKCKIEPVQLNHGDVPESSLRKSGDHYLEAPAREADDGGGEKLQRGSERETGASQGALFSKDPKISFNKASLIKTIS